MATASTTKKGATTKPPSKQEKIHTVRMDALAAVSIETSTLSTAIERAQLALPKKGGKDEMLDQRHIFAALTNGKMEVIGHNFQLGTRAVYSADVARVGEFMIPPSSFAVFPSLSKRVLLQLINEKGALYLHVASGNYESKFLTQSADYYRETLSSTTYTTTFEIREALLIGMIERTLFSVATDDSRYGLNGLYFEVSNRDDADQPRKDMYLRMVSTDGHRLSRVEAIPDKKPSDTLKALIARDLVGIWTKLWKGDNLETSPLLKLEVGESFARITDGDLQAWGQLLEGDFPDYRQVVPKSFKRLVRIPLEPVIDMCQRSLTLTAMQKQQTVRLKVHDVKDGKGVLEVSSSNPDIGEYREDLDGIEVSKMDSDVFVIGLNPKYMMEALKALGTPRIRMCLTDSIGPCVVDDETDPSIQYVLMPVRLE